MIDQPQTEAHIRSLSELLEDTKRVLTGERVSVAALVEALHERGIAMILLIFAAPMALPLPVPPGINIMLATPLILLTLQQAMGRRTVWLPQKTLRKEFDSKGFSKLIDGVVPWMKRIEILLRPRLGFLTRDTASRAFGVLGVIMALTVCIPDQHRPQPWYRVNVGRFYDARRTCRAGRRADRHGVGLYAGRGCAGFRPRSL